MTDKPSPEDETTEDHPHPDAAGEARDDDSDGAAADPLAAMRAVDPEGADALKREWGADFDHNIDLARNAAAAFADTGLVEALAEAGLADDPRLVRAAARLGRLLGRDGSAAAPAPAGKREELEAELERLVGAPDYWSDRVQRRVRRIFLALHGDAALPVHRMAGDAAGVR